VFGPVTHAIKWLQAESVIYDHYIIEMYRYYKEKIDN